MNLPSLIFALYQSDSETNLPSLEFAHSSIFLHILCILFISQVLNSPSGQRSKRVKIKWGQNFPYKQYPLQDFS